MDGQKREARLRAGCPGHDGIRLVARITLFLPGITAIVVAADFPIARGVRSQKLDALQPFALFQK
jgi:hypothetical protein